MMNFTDFDFVANKENSDRTADLLKRVGIRIQQRVDIEEVRRAVYVIAVHPDDVGRAEEIMTQAYKRECEDFVRTLRLARETFSNKDMLVLREPTEDGLYVSGAYNGESFDETQYELVQGGWDHEHCYICSAKIWPGDEWWTAHPPNYEDEIGVCLDCYVCLIGRDSTAG